MSTRTKRLSKAEAKKQTTLYAVGTFLALTVITAGAWAVTRPAPKSMPVVAASAAAEEHVHVQDFERISAEELKALVDAGEATVIDVRSVEQFKASHIAGALQIPVTRIEGEIPYLPKGKTIVTYCTCPAEESSGEAAMILARGGIKARALHGGLEAWTSAGYPTAAGLQ
jgi:rhodanese-related sulfurtransferase